jgi:hypothetical protein
MINEANEPSSACRLWRIYKVETSTPPSKRNGLILAQKREMVKDAEAHRACRAPDKNGATQLHRAVRTRSVEAVKCLLENGSNPMLKNKPGFTPFHLAVQNTGPGGTGADTCGGKVNQLTRRKSGG